MAWLLILVSLALCGCGGKDSRTRPLSSLSEPDRAMLEQYEAVRAGLAQDDFRAAKRAAAAYQKTLESAKPPAPASPSLEPVAKIASAYGLEPQRDAFRAWSGQVIALTKGVEGFYIIHCPLPGCGDWLQKDTRVDNPYMGKAMRECGEVQQ